MKVNTFDQVGRVTTGCRFSLLACAFSVCLLQSSFAEPVVDELEDASYVVGKDDTAHMEVDAGKLTVTARETEPGVWGKHGYQTVFGWNRPGAGISDGFSLNPEDNQYILTVKDMEKVTAPGANESKGVVIYIYFYVFGKNERLEESGEVPPLEYSKTGSWSFNVRDFAIERFGGEDKLPEHIVWRPEFYISTQNQEGVGYSFDSIGATGTPE